MTRNRARRWGAVFALPALAALVACATTATPPAPGRSTAWGYLKLVPHEGLESGGGGGAYGDRRMRDVRLVDYSRPGFAVVYLEGAGDGGPDAPGVAVANDVRLTIRPGPISTRLEPAHLALAAGGSVRIANASDSARLLSCPEVGLVRSLAPGDVATVALPHAGAYAFFLLDVPGASSTVFAAPGVFSVVSDSGRFELANVAPGRRQLHAWHPRLPPASHWIELAPGQVQRLDLEMGVGRGDDTEDDGVAHER